MTERLCVALALAVMSGPALASIAPLDFNAQNHTWVATHIVVVEGEKVVESWKGNLKPGDKLPAGAVEYARIRPPAFDAHAVPKSEKPPAVTGKRMVLFLAHVPIYRSDSKEPVWMGADCPGFPSYPPTAVNVAWIEGDRVYTVVGVHGGAYALRPDGGIAGLKEKVEIGLALQARFEAAKAAADPEKRADRLAALVPAISKYSDLWGKSDALGAVGQCGKSGVPHLVKWAVEPKGPYAADAFYALCWWTGDAGVDAVAKFLDTEVEYWKAFAAALKPGITISESAGSDRSRWRSPNGLYHLLGAVQRMKLSADGQKRLREHAGLLELDRLLTTKPGMKPAKSDMVQAHEILRDILTGNFRSDD